MKWNEKESRQNVRILFHNIVPKLLKTDGNDGDGKKLILPYEFFENAS